MAYACIKERSLPRTLHFHSWNDTCQVADSCGGGGINGLPFQQQNVFFCSEITKAVMFCRIREVQVPVLGAAGDGHR